MISKVFKETMNVDLGEFPHLTYAEAIEKYGTDKPDLRNPIKISVKDLFVDSDFKVFSEPANSEDSRIASALCSQGGVSF